MPPTPEEVAECFEIIGKKASEVDKATLAIIMRSLGMNPTNDEVTEYYNGVSGGAPAIGLPAVQKALEKFDAKMKATDMSKDLKEAFAVFEKDRSGKISSA